MKKQNNYVGQGLKEKTLEECLKRGINPNPNPHGEFHKDIANKKRINAWIKKDQKDTMQMLRMQ